MFPLRLLACLSGLLAAAASCCAGESLDLSKLPPALSRPVDFEREVRPLLEERCVKCHGPEKQKGGWRADLKQEAMTGGDNYAPNIRPGKSAESPLIHFVA